MYSSVDLRSISLGACQTLRTERLVGHLEMASGFGTGIRKTNGGLGLPLFFILQRPRRRGDSL